jgi:hypothetical protein
MPEQHSDIVGGSSVGRLIACPGSYKLSKTVPPQVTSDYAEEGTAIHEAMSFILEEQPKKDTDVIGLTFNGYTITEELFAECIKPALDYLDQIVMAYPDLEMFIEKQVQFDRVPGAYGTADVLGCSKKHKITVLVDWKFGSGVPVKAEQNPQLKFYGYSGWATPTTTHMFGSGDDWKVELHVVQPRMGPEGFSKWTTTVKQLKAFAREVVMAIGHAMSEEPPFKLGDHCKFCPAKAVCPLLVDNAHSVALGQGYDLEKLPEYLERWALMQEWGLGLVALAKSRLEAGHAVPGWKLVAGRAIRQWHDEDAAVRYLKRKKIEPYKKKLISPKQAEDILKARGLHMDDAPCSAVSTKTTMAPESDTRPALSVSVTALAEAVKRIGIRN